MERLMKAASKPNYTTIKLARQTLTTREDILHMALKYGRLLDDGVQMPLAERKWHLLPLLFKRSFQHKTRLYWQWIVFYFALILTFTGLIITAFDRRIVQPSGCYNGSTVKFQMRFHIDEDVEDYSAILHELQKVEVIRGQQLLEQNAKLVYVVTAGFALFQIYTSVKGLNEEIRVAINEHRNGETPRLEAKD